MNEQINAADECTLMRAHKCVHINALPIVACVVLYTHRVTADCAAACMRVMLGESLVDIAQARAQAESFEQDESCCMVMEPKERDVPLGEAIKTLKQVCEERGKGGGGGDCECGVDVRVGVGLGWVCTGVGMGVSVHWKGA
jgi:hypothetical protein